MSLCSRHRAEIIIRFMLVGSALLLVRSLPIMFTPSGFTNPDPRCTNCQCAACISSHEKPSYSAPPMTNCNILRMFRCPSSLLAAIKITIEWRASVYKRRSAAEGK
jgi:hypothetical protein